MEASPTIAALAAPPAFSPAAAFSIASAQSTSAPPRSRGPVDPLLGAEHLEPVAAAVAEPAVVDVGVVAGDDPLHLLVADVKLTLHWLGQSVQTEPEFSMSQGRARNRYV